MRWIDVTDLKKKNLLLKAGFALMAWLVLKTKKQIIQNLRKFFTLIKDVILYIKKIKNKEVFIIMKIMKLIICLIFILIFSTGYAQQNVMEVKNIFPPGSDDTSPSGPTDFFPSKPKTKKPDLIVSLHSNTKLQAGKRIPTLKVIIKNNGKKVAKGTETMGSNGYMIDIILSHDKKLPVKFATYSQNFHEDVLLKGGRISNTPDLLPGESKSFDLSNYIVIPADTPKGLYCLGAVIDPGKKINELNENNNTFCKRVKIIKENISYQQGDLRIKITQCPRIVRQGEDLNARFRIIGKSTFLSPIKNIAVDIILTSTPTYPSPAPYATYSPYYSDGVLLKGGREYISFIRRGKVNVKLNGSNTIPLNTPPGIYYIGAVIDAGNKVEENNEKNNVSFCKIKVLKHIAIVPTPIQISPSSGTKFYNYPRRFTMRWRRVKRATYEVEVDCFNCREVGKWDSEVGPPHRITGITNTSTSFTFWGDNKGRWRVRALRNGTYSRWSPWWYFSFKTSIDNYADSQGIVRPIMPDLIVSNIRLVRDCNIQITIKNNGNGAVPESAYHRTKGAIIQMYKDGIPWRGIRLFAMDPYRKLKTPGKSITYIWYPRARNLKLTPGTHTIMVVVDNNNVVLEMNENNNSLVKELSCRQPFFPPPPPPFPHEDIW